MLIGPERKPRLQLGGEEPLPIDRCEVRRDVDRSLLAAIVRDGVPVGFEPGEFVTLWADDGVIFQGKAIDRYTVLDLISASTDEALAEDELI